MSHRFNLISPRPGECLLQARLGTADTLDGAAQPPWPPGGIQSREWGQARPAHGADCEPGGGHAEDWLPGGVPRAHTMKTEFVSTHNLRDTFTSAHHHNSILMRPQVLREQTHWPSHWCRASTVMTPGSWTASSTERTSRWSTTLSRGYLSRPSSSALVTN